MAEGSPGIKVYLYTAAALMVLLGLTVAVSFLQIGAWGVVIAVTIAFAKALVIALFFMQVRYSSRLTMLFAGAGVFWLLVLFALTFADYSTRF